MPLSSASPSFGPRTSGVRPASRRATSAGTRAPPTKNVAEAHQGGGEMRERRKVAGGTDGSLAGHDGHKARFEAGRKMRRRRPAYARGALREARELQRHGEAHDGNGQRLADARRVREHEIALEYGEIAALDLHARELSEAGVDAVDRLALGDDRGDRPRARLDRRATRRVEACRSAAIDLAPKGEGHGTRNERDGGVHRPLLMRAWSGLKPIR